MLELFSFCSQPEEVDGLVPQGEGRARRDVVGEVAQAVAQPTHRQYLPSILQLTLFLEVI